MSVRKLTTPSGKVRWRAVVDVDPKPDGSRNQRTKTFDTKREATTWAEATRSGVRSGTHVPDSRLTFGSFASSWLAGRRDLKPASVRTYRGQLAAFVDSLGNRPLQRLTTADLDAIVASQLAAGVSARTVNQRIDTISSMLKAAQAQGLVSRNVAKHVVRPRVVATQRPAWTAAELQQWVAHVATRPDAAAMRLLALGMRRGEVLALSWAHVDLRAGTLAVRATRGMIGGTVYTGEPKTTASKRTVHLDPETVAALRALRSEQIEAHLRFGVPFKEDVLITSEPDLSPTHPDTFAYRVRASMRSAGVPVYAVHSIRHTSVSLMLDRGLPLHVVAAVHGHSPAVMLRSYSHADADMLANAAAVAADVLAGRS